MSKYRIVMVRHGESEWNQLNLFCGWYDAGLSEKGTNSISSKQFASFKGKKVITFSDWYFGLTGFLTDDKTFFIWHSDLL